MRANFLHFQIRESVFDEKENQDSLFLLPNARSVKIWSTDEAREKKIEHPNAHAHTRTHTSDNKGAAHPIMAFSIPIDSEHFELQDDSSTEE